MCAGSFSGIFSRNNSVSMPAVRTILSEGEGLVPELVNEEVVFCHGSDNSNVVKDGNGWVICGKVEIYNRADVWKKLAIPNSPRNDLELVLQLYRRFGDRTPHLLNGAFSFAIWNPQTEKLFVARDHLGVFPLFYFLSERFFVFSDSIKLLSKFAFARGLNRDKIIQLLQKIYADKEQTIFSEIRSLSPAYCMQIDKWGCVRQKYWELRAAKQVQVHSLQDAAEGLSERLLTAVRSRIADGKSVGLELSGGLDSSAIAALVSQSADKKRLFAFSNVLPATHKRSFTGFGDEWDKASTVARHLGLPVPVAVDRIDDPVTLSERIVEQTGIPFNFYLSFYQTGIYNAASRQGVPALFSGFGGDEGISMQAGQRYVVSLARRIRLRALFGYYSSTGLPYGKAAAATAYQVGRYALKSKQRENRKYLLNRYDHLLFNDHILTDDDNRKRFLGDDYYKYYSPKERMNFFMTSGGTMARLESGYLISGCYGLSYKYPFLDVPVLEYFYGLPDAYKAGATGDRAVLRKAMEGMLPVSIIDQPKRDTLATATVPFHRVEREKYFEQVKQYLLSLAKDHELFDFWERDKLFSLCAGVHNAYLEGKYYDQLLAGLMLVFFLKNHNAKTFYEI
jgi:asparagine synthase (glutamine-hydrolysing)